MKYIDHDYLEEALIERINDCKKSYPLHETGVLNNCLDIGANIGAFSLLASKKFKKVTAVEANVDSVKSMKKILIENNVTNVNVFNRAVHSSPGEFINIYMIDQQGKEHSGNCSTEVKNSINNYSFIGEPESVETIDLENVLRISGSKYIDYMKIDCEGAEYNFLMGKDLSTIFQIIGEYHEGYLGQKKLNELWSHIRSTHEIEIIPSNCVFSAVLKNDHREDYLSLITSESI